MKKFGILSLLMATFGLWLSCANTNSPGIIFMPGQVPYDSATLSFLARARISPFTSTGKAVGRLVYDLKQANIWTNLYAFYPFIGASSNSCAQNLVSTNYGITWSGTNFFRQSGVTSDGVSGYGDTGFYQTNLVGSLTNNLHIYAFASMHDTRGVILGAIANGGGSGAGSLIWIGSGQLKSTYPASLVSMSFSSGLTYGNIFSQRNGTNSVANAFANAASTHPEGVPATNAVPISYCPTNTFLVLGNPNPKSGSSIDGFGSNTVRAASFGLALTPTQMTNLFTAVNRFQAALYRTAP